MQLGPEEEYKLAETVVVFALVGALLKLDDWVLGKSAGDGVRPSLVDLLWVERGYRNP